MSEVSALGLSHFQYPLPDDRIARFPVTPRDASKLLVYEHGSTRHEAFTQLPAALPPNSFLVFNNTRVIPARLLFTRPTGALIEIFLLNPYPADSPISLAMEVTGSAIWQAMVGNRKRWKPDETLVLNTASGELSARWYDYEASLITLNWRPAGQSFAQVMHEIGQIPLPPYLKRSPVETDAESYQTIYARQEGAVAAPTAGLHFTPAVFNELQKRGIQHDYLTLHVGAGTFQPIKTEDVRQHHMHTEQVVYSQENVQNLLAQTGPIIAVGTTSLRALESLYWIGTRLINREANPFHLDQHYAYKVPSGQQPDRVNALEAVLQYMKDHRQERIVAHTGIYITPGYRFRLCQGIVTNFHQPGSTLILLIAALIGNDWRTVYEAALDNDYRFLSYGDSSLLLPKFKE